MPDEQLAATRVVLRPVANPYALGFLGLAGASLAVSGIELGWVRGPDVHHAALIVLVFAPVLQTISCVFGFLARDPVAATGMGVLGSTWACIGIVQLTSPPGSTSRALGLLLLVSAAATLVASGSAALGKLVPAAVLATTALRFCLTAARQLGAPEGWQDVSGYVGLVVTALAVYGAASLELEDLRRRTILPTGRHGAGARALDGRLADQVEDVAAEAGVRRQL